MTQDTDVYGETTKPFINFHCVHFKDQVSTIQPSVLIAGLTTIKKKLHFTATGGEQGMVNILNHSFFLARSGFYSNQS